MTSKRYTNTTDNGKTNVTASFRARSSLTAPNVTISYPGGKATVDLIFPTTSSSRVAASRDRPDVLDPGRSKQEGRFGVAAVHGRNRVGALWRVRDVRCDPLDDLDVEAIALEQLVAPVAIDDDAGQIVSGLLDRRAADTVDAFDHAMRREDRQPFLPVGTSTTIR